MPTIYDIAREAGVSITTVSNILNNKGRFKPETVARVLEAVERLRYRPNFAARSLAARRTNTVALSALLTPESFDPLNLQYFGAIARAVSDSGFNFLLHISHDPESFERFISLGICDGWLLMMVRRRDERILLLQELGVPFVSIGRPDEMEGIDVVDTDFEQTARLALEHLLALGHRRIAYLAEPLEFGYSAIRLRAYLDLLEEYGLQENADLVAETDGTEAGTVQALKALWSRGDRITAMITHDIPALTVLQTLKSWGLRVPDGVSVVGCSDSPLAALADPPLTTINLHVDRIAAAAAEALARRLQEPHAPPARILIPGRLVVRGSTGPPAGCP
ncbi:LacI family DNA-binding transcriptional regulator [Thermoflexus sp.]|uniref:LacI family DNA-binding transcriptional regulator n=1 Tax=Thermoflexus sp. TaxID=1969742 RepID=UPI0025CE3AE6|nr:LacI family DNA-binding transcriptional regulator [Thermoflexus sp.]MCS7352045.1 LacI family transcriptional regulator [Thermoflexus sp.]MCX7690794.1 LacI family transcriptional regulator [Thermoflexus sp.]MDW8181504.1 LacI family DNA-binding transcriptional regulator [Anaerolineae bacterium]